MEFKPGVGLFYIILVVIKFAVLHITGNNLGTFMLLVILGALGALSLASFVVSRYKDFILPEFTVPSGVAKGAAANGSFIMYRNPIHRTFKLQCVLEMYNTFTGHRDVILVPGSAVGYQFVLDSRFCGIFHIKAHKFQILDPLGIMGFGVDLEPVETSMIFYPNNDQPQYVEIPEAQTMEEENYSATKAGNDPSETFGIREYLPGDPISTIHWKLSEKLDRTMIRELGAPQGSKILLVFETLGMDKLTHKTLDQMAELFFSTGVQLMNAGTALFVGWHRSGGKGFFTYQINRYDDMLFAIRELFLTVDRASMVDTPAMEGYSPIIVTGAQGDVGLLYG